MENGWLSPVGTALESFDPDLVAEELGRRVRSGHPLPAALVPVDHSGRRADLGPVADLLTDHGVTVLTDAAESLGASVGGRPTGSVGDAAARSFNGNRIVTTSGGGAFVTDDEAVARKVRYLATQAREPVRHYEHVEVADPLRAEDGARGDLPSRWLTCIVLDPSSHEVERDTLIGALESQDIETRPVWKPMHLQPVYAGSPVHRGTCAAAAFDRGVALPSGSGLSDEDVDRVIAAIRERILRA